jgi:hypothetical protein
MRIQTAFSQAAFMRMLAIGGLMFAAATPSQATDVGVSLSIGQPGFYGTIDIGDYPRPQVIYAEPYIIRRPRVVPAPVYLRVPPGHEKHWDKHCDEYRACDRPVYFVQDRWYEDVYVPQYRERHYSGGGSNYRGGNDQGDNDQGGHGNGHGNGNGNGKSKGKGGH